jgi:hypothetical protein
MRFKASIGLGDLTAERPFENTTLYATMAILQPLRVTGTATQNKPPAPQD